MTKTKKPHQPKLLKGIHWPVCACCGLVYLKNEATRKRIKDGCVGEEG